MFFDFHLNLSQFNQNLYASIGEVLCVKRGCDVPQQLINDDHGARASGVRVERRIGFPPPLATALGRAGQACTHENLTFIIRRHNLPSHSHSFPRVHARTHARHTLSDYIIRLLVRDATVLPHQQHTHTHTDEQANHH